MFAAHTLCQTYPEEGIECTVLHEFCDDKNGTASCQDTLQPDNIRMVELAHDGRLSKEVSPLALSVTGFQRLYSHDHLPATGLLESTTAHLSELT